MTFKYLAEVYRASHRQRYSQLWNGYWLCREFAQRDVHSIVTQLNYQDNVLATRLTGGNMRPRTLVEQDGMAKFGSLLLPNNPITVDSTSIWIESVMDKQGNQIYPLREVYSLMFFYIKYLSIQMKDRVDFERVCKSLIKRKHAVFNYIPEQQLGTALYFYSAVRYPEQMCTYRKMLSSGSGPGTAMRMLSTLEEAEVGVPVAAANFYWTILKEWCSLFRTELRYTVNYHTRNYERFWYLPLLVQDVYTEVFDGDGKFDNIEYAEDEW